MRIFKKEKNSFFVFQKDMLCQICIKIGEKLDPAEGGNTKTHAFLEPKKCAFSKKRHKKCIFLKNLKNTTDHVI